MDTFPYKDRGLENDPSPHQKPVEVAQHYELRERAHNFQLPPRSSSLTDSNFLTRMLFKNTGCAP